MACPQGYKESFEDFDPFGDGSPVCVPIANTPSVTSSTAQNTGDATKKKGWSINDIISAVGQLGKVGSDFYAIKKGQSTQPTINNNYLTDPNAKPQPDEMPVWAIALIVLVVLVLLAVIFSNFKKKGATTTPQ